MQGRVKEIYQYSDLNEWLAFWVGNSLPYFFFGKNFFYIFSLTDAHKSIPYRTYNNNNYHLLNDLKQIFPSPFSFLFIFIMSKYFLLLLLFINLILYNIILIQHQSDSTFYIVMTFLHYYCILDYSAAKIFYLTPFGTYTKHVLWFERNRNGQSKENVSCKLNECFNNHIFFQCWNKCIFCLTVY